MRRLWAAVGVLMWLAPGAAGQEPANLTDVGWWTRQPGAQPKPDGASEIALAPDGPVSVAGLRVEASGRLQKATLIFTESGGLGQDTAAARVCVTSSMWTSASPGEWSEAPVPDCDAGSADLTRNELQGAWTADVRGLLTAGGAGLVVLPVSSGNLPVNGFRVEFSMAGIDAEAEPGAPAPVGPASGRPATSGETPEPFSSRPFGGLSAPGARPSASEALPTIAEPEAAAPRQPERLFPRRVDTVPPGERDERPWRRLAVLVPLATLVGTGVTYGRRFYRVRFAP